MITLQTSQFEAQINETGAELTHLIDRKTNRDLIWNNPIWPKHAPVLFPAIGRSNEDAYLLDGKRYEMPQHGFASELTFVPSHQEENRVTLTAANTVETAKEYPFDFQLAITFQLVADGLRLSFTVTNEGKRELSYSLGSHPAFNVPFIPGETFDDYEIVLNPKPTTLTKFEIVKTPNPYRSGKELPVDQQDGILALNYDMFEDGLVILNDSNLTSVTLRSKKSPHEIRLDLNDFDYLTLWTKEGAHAPFLCLEPFNGLPDVAGDLRDLTRKEANHHVSGGQTETMAYTIHVK